MMSSTRSLLAIASLSLVATSSALAQYDAPAAYYATVTNQTGASLKSQLTTIMTNGHVQTSYAQARDFLPFTDANPDNLTQMFEFYTHNVIQKPSAGHIGFVGLYESREHVWPDSLQGPGDTSNSTRGSRGDIHMLKPLSQSVNSSRSNNAFSGATLTGAARNIGGGLWFPGSTDKGDAARIIFYGATRWSATLSVVNGSPTTNTQMGDLAALLRFHYQDVPDLFERRRNDAIYRGDDTRTSGDDSTFTGTNNRNAYIDRPEYVWSVFVDQQNDTRLSVGSDVSADGGSSTTVDLGRVLRNAAVPTAKSVTITKAGIDGIYYSVTTTGSATSTITGRYNAFAMDAAGSRTFSVGLATTTTAAGLKTGTVTIDNLDVTTQGGAGRGANDADDIINVELSVLDPANASFDAIADVNTKTVDFGTYALDSGSHAEFVSLANLSSALGASLTAGLDWDGVSVSTNDTTLALNLSAFRNLAAGTSHSASIAFASSTLGMFANTFTLSLSDEDLPGTQSTSTLRLDATGRIALAGDTNYDDRVDFADLLAVARAYGLTETTWTQGDFDRDGTVGFDDLLALTQHYGDPDVIGQQMSSSPFSLAFASDWSLAQALVPEPGFVAIWLAAAAGIRRRR